MAKKRKVRIPAHDDAPREEMPMAEMERLLRAIFENVEYDEVAPEAVMSPRRLALVRASEMRGDDDVVEVIERITDTVEALIDDGYIDRRNGMLLMRHITNSGMFYRRAVQILGDLKESAVELRDHLDQLIEDMPEENNVVNPGYVEGATSTIVGSVGAIAAIFGKYDDAMAGLSQSTMRSNEMAKAIDAEAMRRGEWKPGETLPDSSQFARSASERAGVDTD